MEGQHAESAEISAGWETRKQGWMVLRPAWKSFPICPLGLCSQSPFLLSMCYDCIYRCATSGMKRRTGSTRKPRRRNLWVTDTLQWAPEARLAQPANPMWDSAASEFPVRSQLPFELVCPLRYTLRRQGGS